MKEKLIVCLSSDLMVANSQGARHNIHEMVRSIPSIKILSGDPSISISLEIDNRYTDRLRDTLDGRCTVGPERTFRTLGYRRS
ncbi:MULTISPECIES: hypothetical protein [unclassified Bradyrhizobium]|uniref:hypothetical protein n=1 Tax=unclassified Bradyrhizobium TaxID=2631580 RepID=UPI001FF91CD8|nr:MULTISPECIES: hypothetical protein [unclassified Bradyrhizobium]MCK1412373.1 hypothetical protein [Bradyrhizobium sp. CW4]UPJ26534.1 hypothetical protein IVB54_33490 [Bradyrhizobium sp. CW1]